MISIITGSLLIIAGLGGIFLGAMFLIASSGSTSRLMTGIVFLAGGLVLSVSGFILFRKGFSSRPGSVRARILKTAAKHNGTIAREILMAETGGGDDVEYELAAMIRTGSVREKNSGGRKIFVFPELQFTLKFKKCPYCGADYPVREKIEKCPSCGGDLKIVSERAAGGDDLFSMDG